MVRKIKWRRKNDLKEECFKEGTIRFSWENENVDDSYKKWFNMMSLGIMLFPIMAQMLILTESESLRIASHFMMNRDPALNGLVR